MRHSLLFSTILIIVLNMAACARDEVVFNSAATPTSADNLAGGAAAHPSTGFLPAEHEREAPQVNMPTSAMADQARSGLQYESPAHWEQGQPSSSMRVAQWTLPGHSEAAPAECVIFHFPGGGDPDGNVSRWLGQFRQDDGGDTAANALRAERQVNGLEVTLLKAAGTFLDQNPPMTGPIHERPDYGLFGAVISTSRDPYFLKCTGPEQLIDSEEPAIIGLIDSFQAE